MAGVGEEFVLFMMTDVISLGTFLKKKKKKKRILRQVTWLRNIVI